MLFDEEKYQVSNDMGGIPIRQNLWILWPNEWGLVNIMLHSGLIQQNICVDGWLQWTYTTLLQSFEMLLCQIGVYILYSLVHRENARNEQLLDQIYVPQSTKNKGHMVPKSSLLESGFVESACIPSYTCVLTGVCRTMPYLLYSEKLLGGKNIWHRLQNMILVKNALKWRKHCNIK